MKQITDFLTYAECVAYTYVEPFFISKSTMSLYLEEVGLYEYFYDVFNGKHDTVNESNVTVSHPAKSKVMLTIKALESGNADGHDFNFIIGRTWGDGNISALDDMINNTMTEKEEELDVLKMVCVAHCNVERAPYTDLTEAEFDFAHRKATNTAKTLAVQVGKDITLTLNETLPERVSVTLWAIDEGYADRNLMRPIFIQSAQKYHITASDLRGNSTYEVRVNCGGVDFTLGY